MSTNKENNGKRENGVRGEYIVTVAREPDKPIVVRHRKLLAALDIAKRRTFEKYNE